MSAKIPLLILVASVLPGLACADELTRMVQQDLVTLGYSPGNTDGEATTQTVIAISKFQAEHDLDVTGEVTPQLAGVIKATIAQSGGADAPAAVAVDAAPAAQGADSLRAAQQACLQQKMEQAQASQQRRRGIGRLVRAVTRTASELGSGDASRQIAEAADSVYSAESIAGDFKGAAEDLGLTEGDIEDCRSPQ